MITLENLPELLYETNFMMASYSHSIILFTFDIRNYSRPFDEVVYSCDLTASTSANEPVCISSTATKTMVT